MTTATRKKTESAKIRAKLKHPVVDADGHLIEITPVILDYIKQEAGAKTAQAIEGKMQAARNGHTHQGYQGHAVSVEANRQSWRAMAHWWSQPVNADDRAAVSLPKLLAQRLDDLGVDFTVLYPSHQHVVPGLSATVGGMGAIDKDIARAVYRGYNRYVADITREYSDRMTPVAKVRMGTPQDAAADLTHAVQELGLKAAAMYTVNITRPIAKTARENPEAARYAQRAELFGMDTEYNYDTLWQACMDLKVAVTFHEGLGITPSSSPSPSNYVFNHVGMLSRTHHALAKALFLGGATHRFPELNFAFLEAGVGWAVSLYADLHGHWEKRNGEAIRSLNPARLDVERLMGLVAQYADPKTKAKMPEIRETFERKPPRPRNLDDFHACGVKTPEDFRARFADNFYFGCEADDPVTAAAFRSDVNPMGATLKTVLGSDIAHWDVKEMNEVLEEAWEMVERESITEGQFKEFVFENPVRLHGRLNRDFFKGTRVEAEAKRLLAKKR
ncbi:MAG: amidohydrolase [Dehalococcoidia bacterium]|nr:amidohydrolase [Dehalococcoidia bacterium]